MPRSSSVKPAALTYRKPPLLWRMAAAIFLAMSSRSVFRLMLYAMSAMRAPTTEAPAEGWGAAGPKSGVHPAVTILAPSPSNSPRRMSSRFLRAGFVDASS